MKTPDDWPIPDPAEVGIRTDVFIRSLTLLLHYRREAMPEGHVPTLEVVRPDGETFTPSEISDSDGFLDHKMRPRATRSAKIESPEPGLWRVLVDGQERPSTPGAWEINYSFDLDRRLKLESRLVFTPECAPCWVFEASLAGGSTGIDNLRARAGVRLLLESDAEGQVFDEAQDLRLADDGRGLDSQAGDGLFTSRPWSPPQNVVALILAEVVGTIDGDPFRRVATEGGDSPWDQTLFRLPRLETDRRYEIVPDADVARSYAAQGFQLPSPLGTFRILRFTPSGNADIDWPEPLDENAMTVLFHGAESPRDLETLHEILVMSQLGLDLPLTVQPID
ncbi:MAG: hypothetical protein AAGM22_05680 [Acidobacteriota bacterium]